VAEKVKHRLSSRSLIIASATAIILGADGVSAAYLLSRPPPAPVAVAEEKHPEQKRRVWCHIEPGVDDLFAYVEKRGPTPPGVELG